MPTTLPTKDQPVQSNKSLRALPPLPRNFCSKANYKTSSKHYKTCTNKVTYGFPAVITFHSSNEPCLHIPHHLNQIQKIILKLPIKPTSLTITKNKTKACYKKYTDSIKFLSSMVLDKMEANSKGKMMGSQRSRKEICLHRSKNANKSLKY